MKTKRGKSMNNKISKGNILISLSIILGSVIVSATIYLAMSKLIEVLTLLLYWKVGRSYDEKTEL